MILVAGGIGRLGSALVPRLTTTGDAVRVLTRAPERASHLLDVDVVQGDVRRRPDCEGAVAGVSAVVSAVHGYVSKGTVTPTSVDRDGNANLIAAAGTVGAHVVLLSVVGAAADHPVELFRMKAAAEETLRRSGLPWTIVRAGAFTELHADLLRQTAARSGRPVVFGRGDNPIRFASVPDVAAAVHRALHDPACRNAVVDVPGPTLTLNELAATLEPELGIGARRPRHVARPLLRALATAAAPSLAGRRAAAALALDSHDMSTA